MEAAETTCAIVCLIVLLVYYIKKKHPYLYVLGESFGFFLIGLFFLLQIVGLKECLIYSTATICFAHAWGSLKDGLEIIEKDVRQRYESNEPSNKSTKRLLWGQTNVFGIVVFLIFFLTALSMMYTLITGKTL